MGGTEEARVTVIGDAAIRVLAGQGMRGLTHRAVDAAAGLAGGSTSYYARTRQALLELAMNRMYELTDRNLPPVDLAADLDQMAGYLAGFIESMITEGRTHTTARFEFALEATRRPELREIYDRTGRRFRAHAEEALRALGATDPARQARSLLAWCDGLVFDSTVGSGAADPPSAEELRVSTREFLSALFG